MRAFLGLSFLFLSASSWAKGSITCITKNGGKYSEPATLAALVDCQQSQFDGAEAAYKAAHQSDPPPELIDAWQDKQRAAVSDYLSRHPNRASLERPSEAAAEEPAKGKDAKAADASKDDGTIDALSKKLQRESDGGKKGITPEMAQQIRESLIKQQGSVSPDMQRLLDKVQRDGVNLKTDTMADLQDAAKQAKGSGLDLNTDQKTQDLLLGPSVRGEPDPSPSPNSN